MLYTINNRYPMSSHPSANAHTRWAKQIVASSVGNNKFHLHNQCTDTSIDELKANLTKKLIEANTQIIHSRFDIAIAHLYSTYYNKHDFRDKSNLKECWIYFPMEMWFVLFKAINKINSVAKLMSHVRGLSLQERLKLIFTIYNITPNQSKANDTTSRVEKSNKSQLNKHIKSSGFVVKNITNNRVNIITRGIRHGEMKMCVVKMGNQSVDEDVKGRLVECKTSIWSFNRDVVKNVIVKTDLLIECLIFLCELARGFDDLPIISYDRILIDKIPLIKKLDSPLFRIILTIFQYENFKLKFCFYDLNMTVLISSKKISLKKIEKSREVKNLKLLEVYKQCFRIKQNYIHEETNPILSCIYLLNYSNFSHIYKTYRTKKTSDKSRYKHKIPISRYIKNMLKCCSYRQNVENRDKNDELSVKSTKRQVNLTDIYSDIMYTLDLLFEQSQSNVNFPISGILPPLATILDWIFLLSLSTIYNSTLLYNIITRLTLFGMKLSPFGEYGAFTKFASNSLKFGYRPEDLDICSLDTRLLLIHNLTSKSYDLSNLDYILTDINSIESPDYAMGARIKCLEKIMKFILCNLNLGYRTYSSEYIKVKGIVDSEIGKGNLVTVDLLVTLALSEMLISRYESCLNYIKLALSRNELNKNCWRIAFTLKRMYRQVNIVLVKSFKNSVKFRISKGKMMKFTVIKPILALKSTNLYRIKLSGLPIELMSIMFMKTFKLAKSLEDRLLESEWWFPWEAHIANLVNGTVVGRVQYDLVISRRNSNISVRDMYGGLDMLLRNLLKNDISGINDTLWVLSDIEFPLYKNECFYELFITLWVLCHIGYAKTVVNLIGINTNNDPDSSYLSLYAQLCLAKNVYDNDLICKVKNLAKKYQSFHRLTRLEARLRLANGEFIKAKKLFSKARNGYFEGAYRGFYGEDLLTVLVSNICGNYSATSTDIICEDFCNKCTKDQTLCF